MPASHGAERIARSGLTLLPARQVAPPLIGECRAHLECTLKSVTRLGAEVVVFGTIVAASIDEDCAASCLADQYFRLRPVFFLEEGVYGIDRYRQADRGCLAGRPIAHSRGTVRPPGDQDVEAHVAFLRSLRDSGVLLMAGPYDGWRDEPDRSRPAGMIILAVPEEQSTGDRGNRPTGPGRSTIRHPAMEQDVLTVRPAGPVLADLARASWVSVLGREVSAGRCWSVGLCPDGGGEGPPLAGGEGEAGSVGVAGVADGGGGDLGHAAAGDRARGSNVMRLGFDAAARDPLGRVVDREC